MKTKKKSGKQRKLFISELSLIPILVTGTSIIQTIGYAKPIEIKDYWWLFIFDLIIAIVSIYTIKKLNGYKKAKILGSYLLAHNDESRRGARRKSLYGSLTLLVLLCSKISIVSIKTILDLG